MEIAAPKRLAGKKLFRFGTAQQNSCFFVSQGSVYKRWWLPAVDWGRHDGMRKHAAGGNMLVQDGNMRLQQARVMMENNGVIPPGLVRLSIAESWRRCLDAGLDPRKPPKPERISAPAVERHRARYSNVRELALAEMQALHRQLGVDAFVLAFAAPDGVLLDSLMSEANRAEIETFGIVPGAPWSEATLGTNGLGTAIAARSRIDVRGAEHFFSDHNRLSCVAAPIFGPDRQLAGVLDASCAVAAYAPHVRGVIALSAAQIEAQLFRISQPRARLLVLHGRAEFLDTAYAGLLALDDADRVIAANDQARFMLAGLPDPTAAPLNDLFEPAGIWRQGVVGRLTDRTGRVFYVRVDAATPELPRSAPKRPETGDAVAEDAAVRVALDMVARAAQRRLPVLIRGETGTGKEVVARFAHRASGRPGKFVAVNCAAIPPDLLAAELFGHAEGAFTGARRGGSRGLACEADGGTLFLDEIADLPAGVQAALLRFLDDFSVRPVGGASSRVVDTLLLAATNADLPAAVAAGKFRADLYYRLAITEIVLPRLAARTDFRALAQTLLAGIAPQMRLSEAALEHLAAHDWPGNIRQLRNLLLRLSLSGAARIEVADVAASLPCAPAPVPCGSLLRDAQALQVKAAMQEAGGNVSAAARKLGVSRNTIYRTMRGDE
jgi:transcriptional regulator of acetoin/glycerol metabolism